MTGPKLRHTKNTIKEDLFHVYCMTNKAGRCKKMSVVCLKEILH